MTAALGLLCPCCGDETPLPETSDAGRVETARACVRAHDDEHRRFVVLHGDTLPPPPESIDDTLTQVVEVTEDEARALAEAMRRAADRPRWITLFGLRAAHRYGRTYEASIGQVTYIAHDEGGRWTVAVHDAASLSCWAIGYGATLAEAESTCERSLRREGRIRTEAAQEIAERRKAAA